MPYCQGCGHEVIAAAVVCPACGRTLTPLYPPQAYPQAYAPPATDPALRLVVPVGVSGLAIAAGYAALFAFVLCGAPFALVLGILAYRDLKRNPHKHGWGRTWFALIMGAVGTLILLFLFLGAALAPES